MYLFHSMYRGLTQTEDTVAIYKCMVGVKGIQPGMVL